MARCQTCHRRLKPGQSCSLHGGAVGSLEVPMVATAPALDGVGELLGSGGFASVWELGPDRVIKVAHASHDLARARLAREAEALAAIGAPAVPALHARGTLDDGRPWIAIERIRGTTIADVTTAGPVRASEAVGIGIAILDALGRVHRAGFAHRDLKPDNLVRRDGAVVILDLGLARKLPQDPDDPTRANVQVGSLEYMPPEQIVDSASVDARSDLYAFGCVLYELCAGRPPFVGDAAALERAHAALRPPRLGALADVPAAVEAIVQECLQKEPARRPASAAAIASRLVAASTEPVSAKLTHSVSLIREGKQPVVLLWAELPRVDRALLGLLTARRLVVISQRGRRVLAAVLGGEHADPASAAIAAARDLAAAGARVALHLEALRVESTGGGSTIHGEPVDKPETWVPAQPWIGVVLTRALASVTQAPTRASEAGAEFRALAAEQAAAELFGRDVLLTDLAADAAAALRGMPKSDRSGSGTWDPQGPALALLVGETGVGKTAFASELGRRLGELGIAVHFGAVPAPGTGKPGYSALAAVIGDLKAEVGPGPAPSIIRPVGDALRAAARKRPTAVILDDVHLAEHDLLDALEYATLGGESLPLWVLAVASPRLDQRRPQFGQRAERHRRATLAPLEEDAAVALLASLLQPAEYPPLRALRRLVALAHGNPLHLAMLAREIHERGAIRERPGGAGHFLDIGALDDLQQLALGPWLAARELAGLGPELIALARLCAVLGGEVSRDELLSITERIERAGGASTPVDIDVGLRELVKAQILVPSTHGFMFRQALVEEGVYATTNEDERRALHRAALAYWRTRPIDDAAADERVARHAEATDERELAATAYAKLGERAMHEHRSFDAEQAWSGAIRNSTTRDEAQARALIGRARARYRLQRMRDGVVDLEDATAIARDIGATAVEIEALLETAVVIDFMEIADGAQQVDRTKAVIDRARERLASSGPELALLALDLDLADGRTLFRQRKFEEAAEHLGRTLVRARAARRHETATIAALLLGPVLSDLRRLDEAEAVFGAMIEDCESLGDRFHLAAAYGNRAWLWSARGMVERSEEDLRRVIQLAREAGQAHFERVATYNLAEDRLWQGQLDEALQLARRSLALQSRAGEGTDRPDRLLVARVLAARGDLELAQMLATFDAEALSGDDAIVVDVLRAIEQRDPARGETALAATTALLPPQRLELCHLAARQGWLSPASRSDVVALATQDPIWSRRVNEF